MRLLCQYEGFLFRLEAWQRGGYLKRDLASIDKVEKEAFELDRISITEIFPKARKGKRNHYDSTIPVPERMR